MRKRTSSRLNLKKEEKRIRTISPSSLSSLSIPSPSLSSSSSNLNNNQIKYWLIKSEPDKFSIIDLSNKPLQTNCWDGVRNYQARNYIQTMKLGDKAFFYHSSCGKDTGIYGEVEVVREFYPDYTVLDKNHEENPIWFMMDVKLTKIWDNPLKLETIRKVASEDTEISEKIKNMKLLKNSRLSVQPLLQSEWDAIIELSQSSLQLNSK